jgi:hypothetical protein
VFEHQNVLIESGEGKSYFKAEVTLDTMASTAQTKLVMDGLRQMQKDRMDWASTQTTSAKVSGQGPIPSAQRSET